jgi:DeoR family transcriptional regulator, fructose operon transcriptional repressor
MIAHERHSLILSLLSQRKRMTAADIQVETGASAATLRRDLEFLASQDLLVRLHGVVLHPSVASGEPSLVQKMGMSLRAKQRIGEKAANLVGEGETVFIDSGSTCLEVARQLRSRPDLSIITNSLAVIAGHEHFKARLIVVGGERRAVSGALVGEIAGESIRALRADIAFLGASGLDMADGPGTTELMEKSIKATWIARARRKVLVCDASKWSAAASFVFAPWESFTDFVTDQPPEKTFKKHSPKIHLS